MGQMARDEDLLTEITDGVVQSAEQDQTACKCTSLTLFQKWINGLEQPTLFLFPNKPWFSRVCSTSLLKILCISPFPTVFSTLLENFIPFLSNLKLLSANSLSLEESKSCRLGKG